MEWRSLAAEGRWSEIDWTHLEPGDQAELLHQLRSIVPTIEITNGMETETRHRTPEEITGQPGKDQDLRDAAAVLMLGELQAAVEGGPMIASQQWHTVRKDAETFLQQALHMPELTEGDPERSRQRHASEALQTLAHFNSIQTFYASQMESDADKLWLREVFSDANLLAFQAGRQMQIAWGKEFESDAVRGAKTLQSSEAGGRARKNEIAPETQRILDEMKRLIDAGHTANSAGTILSKKGVGKSAGANAKLWGRHRKKV